MYNLPNRTGSRRRPPGLRRLGPGAVAMAALSSMMAGLAPVAGATGITPASVNYVAMGDSYTSAPKVPTQIAQAGGCDRSTQDYPSLTAANMKFGTLTDVSCSGATTANIDTTPEATSGFTNPPQLDAVTTSTNVVSIQVGGDDLGFTSIIENCVALTPWGPTKVGLNCRNYYDPKGNDSLRAAINALAAKITTLIGEIKHQAASGVQIFVVGYPDILPQSGACWPTMPFETADAQYLNGVEQYLNTALANAASGAGATFVDTYTTSEGYNACTSASTRWIEPIVPSAPADPVHPNANGEAHMAALLEAAMTTKGL